MSRECVSRTYSYYFDRFCLKLFDFNDKEMALRDYIVYMLNRTQKIFEYDGLPDTIPKRMLEYLLQINGFACFAKVNGELYAFYGGLGGEPDPYYRPTLCVVANPALKLSETFEIGKDCVIVRNDSFMYGLIPMFRRYATAMVENDISFKMAAVNTRIEALLSAPDDSTKEAAEQYLKDVEAGKLGVIASNEFLEGIKAQPMTSSMRTFTDLIEYQQYLKASWYNEIGLNANYNMKREKLSTTESQMNSDALLPLVDDMLENRQKCLDEVNAMFGTNITVRFASSWKKLIEEFESNQLDGGEENDMDDSAGIEELREDGIPEDDSGASGEVEKEPADGSEGGTDEVDAQENTGDGEDSGTGETGEVMESADASDSGDVQVTVEVEVNVNDAEWSESDESVREEPDERSDSGSTV